MSMFNNKCTPMLLIIGLLIAQYLYSKTLNNIIFPIIQTISIVAFYILLVISSFIISILLEV